MERIYKKATVIDKKNGSQIRARTFNELKILFTDSEVLIGDNKRIDFDSPPTVVQLRRYRLLPGKIAILQEDSTLNGGHFQEYLKSDQFKDHQLTDFLNEYKID